MKQEDKELLLRDLCARLPYGVKVKTPDSDISKILEIDFDRRTISVGHYCNDVYVIDEIKPYLRPISSMTNKERDKYRKLCEYRQDGIYIWYSDTLKSFDFLIQNGFDYRGLISKGLAIDATGLNIY